MIGTESWTRDFLSVFYEARQLLFKMELIFLLVLNLLSVSGDNANTLKDMPTKAGREEKEAASTTTTTTEPTTSTSLANVESNEFETEVATESFWKEGETAYELESGKANIRNSSDARGIFSNMVKTINRCKYTLGLYCSVKRDTEREKGNPSVLYRRRKRRERNK